ncbi:hypothetical protein ABG811_10435 [Streptococcus iniae]
MAGIVGRWKKGFIAFYRQLIACNEVSYRLYLKGLDQDAKYLINGATIIMVQV